MIPQHELSDDHANRFIEAFYLIERTHNRMMWDKKFWEGDDPTDINHDLSKIAMMHGELGEASEAIRHGNPPSEKIVGFSHVEEELADVCLRVMDFSCQRGYRTAEALIAKMHHNFGRPEKHNKLA